MLLITSVTIQCANSLLSQKSLHGFLFLPLVHAQRLLSLNLMRIPDGNPLGGAIVIEVTWRAWRAWVLWLTL